MKIIVTVFRRARSNGVIGDRVAGGPFCDAREFAFAEVALLVSEGVIRRARFTANYFGLSQIVS